MDTAEHQLSPTVERFRQVVLWPVQLVPRDESIQIQSYWEHLTASGEACVWKEVADEFTGQDPSQFSERHYKEFVTFLPYVQRFLYGEGIGAGGGDGYGGSPIRVFRRHDVSHARITFPGDPQPVVFDIAHVDLYFFYDIDIAILVVEIAGEKLPLDRPWRSCIDSDVPIPPTGNPTAAEGTARNGWNGCPAAARCWPFPTTKRLSEFIEALSDERLQRRDKLNILLNVWERKGRARDGGKRNRLSL